MKRKGLSPSANAGKWTGLGAAAMLMATGCFATGALRLAAGPLRMHPTKPRYFTDVTKDPDGSLQAVYLTGSHTWANLIDRGPADPPPAFDFAAYLDLLREHHHNFIRLWGRQVSVSNEGEDSSREWQYHLIRFIHQYEAGKPKQHSVGMTAIGSGDAESNRALSASPAEWISPHTDAWGGVRNVPAADGAKVSLLDSDHWFVVDLYNNPALGSEWVWAWRAHPFHPGNNVNGIDAGAGGDGTRGRVHSLAHPAVNKLQAAYLHKVVDTVNDFDNVLYEVINEGGEKDWDWWVVNTIPQYEQTKPKQHPIGITGHGAERLRSMLDSPADWISPGRADGYAEDPPAWDGKKVSLLDTDHIWGVGGTVTWVWKSFLRGHNPIFMDPYDGSVLGKPSDTGWEPIRRALGQTRCFAERVGLVALTPAPVLASTRYCLANAGKEYLVYQPDAGKVFSLDLKAGTYRCEWFDARNGVNAVGGQIESSGGAQQFKVPFEGEAVLYLKAE